MDTQIVQSVSQMTREIIDVNKQILDVANKMIFDYTNKLFCLLAVIAGGAILFQWIQRNRILKMIDNRVDENIKNLDGKIKKIELDLQNAERRLGAGDDWGLALVVREKGQQLETLYFFVRALRTAVKPTNVLNEENTERLVAHVEASMEAWKPLEEFAEEYTKEIAVFLNEIHIVGFTTRLEKTKKQFAEKVNLFNEHKKSDKSEGDNKK